MSFGLANYEESRCRIESYAEGGKITSVSVGMSWRMSTRQHRRNTTSFLSRKKRKVLGSEPLTVKEARAKVIAAEGGGATTAEEASNS